MILESISDGVFTVDLEEKIKTSLSTRLSAAKETSSDRNICRRSSSRASPIPSIWRRCRELRLKRLRLNETWLHCGKPVESRGRGKDLGN